MIRKAALVGCKEGPWIAIHGLVKPQLRAQGATRFQIEDSAGHKGTCEAGVTDIGEGTFIRVSVLEGEVDSALCDIISGGRRAIRGT